MALPRRQANPYVTEGKGLVQSRGGDIKEIRAGDAIHTPADKWHWHGADPDRFMTPPGHHQSRPQRQTTEADRTEHGTDDEYNNR
ncbi:MAG: cupin domain-containing protein [Pseudonocardiaceae bacterium]